MLAMGTRAMRREGGLLKFAPFAVGLWSHYRFGGQLKREGVGRFYTGEVTHSIVLIGGSGAGRQGWFVARHGTIRISKRACVGTTNKGGFFLACERELTAARWFSVWWCR